MHKAPVMADNRLLATLPAELRERLRPRLELIGLPAGKVVQEAGSAVRHAWFPVTCVVSLLNALESGACGEVSVVGNDGIAGVELFLGGTPTTQAVVQCEGYAFRLAGEQLLEEFQRSEDLRSILLRYTQFLIVQMAQTAICNRHHTVDQQLCRWLLLSLDRLQDNKLNMTQGAIADMLGVRREGVTDAAGKLQKQGVISYTRGKITVLDRQRLERLSCECYGVVRDAADRFTR